MMTDWNTGNETDIDYQVELVYVDGIWLSRCRPIILSGWYRLRMVPYGATGMGMFETTGRTGGGVRKTAALRKLERMRKTLRHEEPDRVPISDFFWGGFLQRWRKEHGLPEDANPYYHYDLDWIVTVPNMDPWIRPFETLRETLEEVVVRTGFGAVMRKKFACPMPEMTAWETDTFEKLEAVEFDPPEDRRRFFDAGDNQIAEVGDGFERNSPAWIETVKSLRPDFPVYGSMIECAECLTRLIGQQNTMLWMGLYPHRMGKVINRIGEFYTACAKAEIDEGAGHLAAGQGKLDYDRYLFLLQTYRFRGPLLLHGLSVAQVPGRVAFLRQKLAGLPSVASGK